MENEIRPEDGVRIFYAKPGMIPISKDLLSYSDLSKKVEDCIHYVLFEAAERSVDKFSKRVKGYRELLEALNDRIDEAKESKLEGSVK